MPSSDLTISDVRAWEAFDSRGHPTVGCLVTLAGGANGRAIVPSGASRGRHEAPEWRDGGTRLGGLGVRAAIEMIRTSVKPALIGVDTTRPELVDAILPTIVAPRDRGHLGSNTTLAVSVAAARAGATGRGLPLWGHICNDGVPSLPMPMIQVLAGGVHAGRVIDIQDVMIVPVGATTFAEAVEIVWRVREAAKVLADTVGHSVHLVGDEGGLAIPFRSNRAAIEFVARSIDQARLDGCAAIAIDIAASQLIDAHGQIRLSTEDRVLDRESWLTELEQWVRDLPIWSIEDPIDEDDWDGWRHARIRLGVAQLVGDDLFVTDIERLRHGVDVDAANAILVKPNQRGTLTAAADTLRAASLAGVQTIVSARSADTEDYWLADLAVGWHANQIKVGSLARSERNAKWNRLLEIETFEPSARFVPIEHAGQIAECSPRSSGP